MHDFNFHSLLSKGLIVFIDRVSKRSLFFGLVDFGTVLYDLADLIVKYALLVEFVFVSHDHAVVVNRLRPFGPFVVVAPASLLLHILDLFGQCRLHGYLAQIVVACIRPFVLRVGQVGHLLRLIADN